MFNHRRHIVTARLKNTVTATATFTVKGGSLFHALFAIFIIGALLTVMVSMSFFRKKVNVHFNQQNRLIENLESARDFALTSPDLPFEAFDLFGEGQDSVSIQKRYWGLFEMANVTAFRAGHQKSRTYFIGDKGEQNSRIALYLADRNQSLKLSGKTRIEGQVAIPGKGVERGRVGNTNYNGDKLIYGKQETSGKSVPEINEDLIRENNLYLNGNLSASDSLIEMPLSGDSLSLPFNGNTAVLDQSNSIVVGNVTLNGNIIIRSDKNVFLSAVSNLSDIVVYGGSIEIEEGFTGSVQCFATDSIIVGPNVNLTYPSSLVVQNSDRQAHQVKIHVDTLCNIHGQVLMYDDQPDFRNLPLVSVGEGSKVEGEIYSNGFTELKGTVYGTVWTRKFYLKTPASTYENSLLNATIVADSLSPHFVGGALLSTANRRKEVLKWVD